MNGMEAWRGKTALVTGASSGIGRATAAALAAAGMRVAVCARRVDKLRELAGEVLALAVDLLDEKQIVAMFAAVRAKWGGVDVLVNNAGLGHHAPLMDGDTAAWRETLELNVIALSVCTREAIRDMRGRGDDGYVIHVSSMAAHRVPRQSGMYSASKYAVRSLTESLRQELREAKSKIRVTAISPGFVETEFAARYHRSEEAAQRTYSRYPCLQPEDVAGMVVYALSQPAHVQIHDLLVRPTEQES
jgi:17beta-estradiol 17-dehydrogenase / 3beta-hydroxysteroid 3-dehydrogenase